MLKILQDKVIPCFAKCPNYDILNETLLNSYSLREMTMKQQIFEMEGFQISGIKTRTNNQSEMEPDTARIPVLWHRLEEELITQKIESQNNSGILFGVYSDFSDEDRGDYSLLIGKETDAKIKNDPSSQISSVDIRPGKYLLFSGEGKMPEIVMKTWTDIWAYFNSSSEYRRAFKTDFEKYDPGQESKVEIYISVV